MKKQVIISDIWYKIGNKDYEIYDWPEECKKLFKQIFTLI